MENIRSYSTSMSSTIPFWMVASLAISNGSPSARSRVGPKTMATFDECILFTAPFSITLGMEGEREGGRNEGREGGREVRREGGREGGRGRRGDEGGREGATEEETGDMEETSEGERRRVYEESEKKVREKKK